MTTLIDLSFRPDTYWPDALTQEQLLSRIKGRVRREMAREILETDGFAGLAELIAQEDLDGSEREAWGRVHPDFMGGEYLPALLPTDVEIARISLASVMSDQISIRARYEGEKIRYLVCGEYDFEYALIFDESDRPLSLGELIEFIDKSRQVDDEFDGLLQAHWEFNYSESLDAEQSVAFAWISSSWYPQLAYYYGNVADEWYEQKSKDYAAEYGDEYEEEEEEVQEAPHSLRLVAVSGSKAS